MLYTTIFKQHLKYHLVFHLAVTFLHSLQVLGRNRIFLFLNVGKKTENTQQVGNRGDTYGPNIST